jgi:hypothetical protein
MATDFKSPLGLLDYLVPDQIEKMAISGFAQPLTPEQLAKENDAQRKARLTQYGSFTPDIDPNNPTGLSNIQTLLGNAYFPQALNYGAGKGPSNKQMIDAAILRAGLEGGKGRLPGENFGAAFNRSMNAMSIPAKTLADAQLAQRKASQAGSIGDSQAYAVIRKDVEAIIPDISSTFGISKISPARAILVQYLNTAGRESYNSSGISSIDKAITDRSDLVLQILTKDPTDGSLQVNDSYKGNIPPEIEDLRSRINAAIINERNKPGGNSNINERELD